MTTKIFFSFIFSVLALVSIEIYALAPESEKIVGILGVWLVLLVVLIGWRLLTGKWVPDGSFAGSHSPSGLDWDAIGKAVDKGVHPKDIFDSDEHMNEYRYPSRKK